MYLSTRLKAGVGAVALSCSVLVTTSCSLGPNDLPSVRGGIGNGYAVTLQFASVMNLPAGADVMMDGLRVGEVRSVDASRQAVTVAIEVKEGTRVPADVRAVIRQDTLLGDTYIALDHDANTGANGYLQAGGTVPVARTSSPPQLEDTMAVLAYFVNGGSIRKVQDAMTKINTVMPALPDVRNMATVVAGDLRDLSQNTTEIDRMLDGFNATAVVVDDKSPTLSLLFSDQAAYLWRREATSIVRYVGQMLPSIGSIFKGGAWLVPMLDGLANAGAGIRDIYDVASSEKLTNFLRETLLPYIEHPSVNIKSVESANGDQIVADVENLLRMLGAVK